jgi:hypothetical protein
VAQPTPSTMGLNAKSTAIQYNTAEYHNEYASGVSRLMCGLGNNIFNDSPKYT